MSDIILSIENVSKEYQLGTIGAGTFRGDVQRWWYRMRGKEDPFKKIGTNDRSLKTDDDFVLALQDINLQVKRGEVLGIIGKNGAGKSTLLKLLSRVTSPTTGSIKVGGRMASLLEVGTGFHQELTGRENIFLNGAILGMTKLEIKSKLDEIVEFSGCAQYIDTPVKRYSSGMNVRLGFAVAAFLEPEVLIVDEVLAVGDAEFQKKAIGKMKDISSAGGRTVLFVSHNMASVRDLCTSALILENGKIKKQGATKDMVNFYLDESKDLSLTSETLMKDDTLRRGNGELRFIDVSINNNSKYLEPDKDIYIDLKVKVNETVKSCGMYMLLRNTAAFEKFKSTSFLTGMSAINIEEKKLIKGAVIDIRLKIPANTLRTGLFPLYFWLGRIKEEGTIGSNYNYDTVDSVQFLNIKSNKKPHELGYDSFSPMGYFNIDVESEIL